MDKDLLELNFEQEGDQVALMLSIPVIRAKDEDEIDNIDYNLPLNRERGRAIDSLMHTCWDKNYADDILNVLEQIIPIASITSKVGILFRMACLLN